MTDTLKITAAGVERDLAQVVDNVRHVLPSARRDIASPAGPLTAALEAVAHGLAAEDQLIRRAQAAH